jgi:hypothetical protein
MARRRWSLRSAAVSPDDDKRFEDASTATLERLRSPTVDWDGLGARWWILLLFVV